MVLNFKCLEVYHRNAIYLTILLSVGFVHKKCSHGNFKQTMKCMAGKLVGSSNHTHDTLL